MVGEWKTEVRRMKGTVATTPAGAMEQFAYSVSCRLRVLGVLGGQALSENRTWIRAAASAPCSVRLHRRIAEDMPASASLQATNSLALGPTADSSDRA